MNTHPPLSNIQTRDVEALLHPYTPLHKLRENGPTVIERGKGVYVYDTRGKEYIEGMSGLWCAGLGFGDEELIDAATEQMRTLPYYHLFGAKGMEPAIELAEKLKEIAPVPISKVFFTSSGSEANDTQVKLAWYMNNALGRPEKKKIISRWRGYHGSGLMTGSLTGLHLFHKKFDLPLEQVIHTEAPYYYRRENTDMTEEDFVGHCVYELEQLIEREGADTIAAFIGEPALGTGGLVPPPAGYWEAIQKVLEQHDILLIADEVVTGFGRLGSMFGSDHYGIKPDLITIAKGLTSAYAPLSGSIVSDKMWKVLEQGTDENGPIGHGWTYSAHPIGAAAGIANLKLIDDLNLVQNAGTVGAHFKAALKAEVGDHAHVGEVRGEGLLCAVEFVKDPETRTFFDPSEGIGAKLAGALLSEGVIARAMPQGDILGFAPPFCLTEAQADEIATKLGRAVRSVLG